MNDVTRILSRLEQGDPNAVEELLPLVYEELRRLAAKRLSQEASGQTLQATALVHEAYLRLVGPGAVGSYTDLKHFFAVAAAAMRRILIDRARRKRTRKHGGGLNRQPLELVVAPEPDEELLALDEALGGWPRSIPQGPVGRTALLRRIDGRAGRGGPGHLTNYGRSLLVLCPCLAPGRGPWPLSRGSSRQKNLEQGGAPSCRFSLNRRKPDRASRPPGNPP